MELIKKVQDLLTTKWMKPKFNKSVVLLRLICHKQMRKCVVLTALCKSVGVDSAFGSLKMLVRQRFHSTVAGALQCVHVLDVPDCTQQDKECVDIGHNVMQGTCRGGITGCRGGSRQSQVSRVCMPCVPCRNLTI